jgi:hypothetical protein
VTRVAAGSTKDIDLGPLPPGAYAVQVRADVPLVAGVMVERRRVAGGPSDLGWSTASVPVRTLAGMALPSSQVQGFTQQLDLAATSVPASVRVTTVASGGAVTIKDVAIAANSTSALPLSRATSVWVTPRSGLVRAAVLTSVTDAAGVMLSLSPLSDLPLTTTPLSLRQLRD